MKAIVTLFLILILEVSPYAQTQNATIRLSKTEQPILIVNDTIIGSMNLLDTIPSDKVLGLNIFKEKPLSTTSLFVSNKKKQALLLRRLIAILKLKHKKN